MTKLTIAATTVGALIATALGSAGLAGATAVTPLGGSAADTVKILQGQGYNVRLNAKPEAPLSECTVTGVHGLDSSTPLDPTRLNTVYLDISCSSNDD
jgi:hypothetical protein